MVTISNDVGLFGRWQIWALAASVVGIEIGYLLAYRAGWPQATTTGVTYTSTMVFLAVIGAAFFDQALSLRRMAGLALAIASVWLLVAPSRAP